MTDDWDVVVVGGVNTDFLVRGPALPRPGEPVHGDALVLGSGGKGANQAVAAARLGARVALVGAVGADERGDALIRHLQHEGVNTSGMLRRGDAETGAAVIQSDEIGRKQTMAFLGANATLRPKEVTSACEVLNLARVVVAQLEIPVDAAIAALAWARATGATTVLDPSPPRTLVDDVLQLVDVIRMNSREAEVLTGINPESRTDARYAALLLRSRGVGAAIVEAGIEGNLVVSSQAEYWLPRVPVDSVDVTGAGDAFVGTLAAWLARGESLEEAARIANLAAAFATTRLGAQGALAREEDLRAIAHLSSTTETWWSAGPSGVA